MISKTQNSAGKTNVTSQSGYLEMNFSKFRGKDDGYSFTKMKDEFESKKSIDRKSTINRKDFPDRQSEGT